MTRHTNNRRRNNRRNNQISANERARREGVRNIIQRTANQYDVRGQGAFQRALRRELEAGRNPSINPADIFELVRIYAYAGELHTAEYNRREREGIPQTYTDNRPYFIVDHIIPHSSGGRWTPSNLGIANEAPERVKGDSTTVELEYIEIPEDFALFNKTLQREVTSYTAD